MIGYLNFVFVFALFSERESALAVVASQRQQEIDRADVLPNEVVAFRTAHIAIRNRKGQDAFKAHLIFLHNRKSFEAIELGFEGCFHRNLHHLVQLGRLQPKDDVALVVIDADLDRDIDRFAVLNNWHR